MRFLATAVVLSMLSLACSRASATSVVDNRATLIQLQAKADHAEPRDQCFLYAELVSRMTDLAGQQFNAGDSVRGVESLKLVQQYSDKIQVGIADDSKKLKLAEMLMRRTSSRLKEILYAASYDDRPALETMLNQMNKVQTQLMMEVFKK